jgi:hypothetical protein
MRLLLIALLPLTLAGCWTGWNLYSTSDARPAIPSGVYRATTRDAPDRVYRVSMLPDGLTQFDGGEKKEVYGFAPLDPGTFVAWLEVEDEAPASGQNDENQIYALMVRQPDGSFRVYAPECRNDEAEIARKAGATVNPGASPTCRFPSRAALEKALRLFPRDESSALRLARIP